MWHEFVQILHPMNQNVFIYQVQGVQGILFCAVAHIVQDSTLTKEYNTVQYSTVQCNISVQEDSTKVECDMWLLLIHVHQNIGVQYNCYYDNNYCCCAVTVGVSAITIEFYWCIKVTCQRVGIWEESFFTRTVACGKKLWRC